MIDTPRPYEESGPIQVARSSFTAHGSRSSPRTEPVTDYDVEHERRMHTAAFTEIVGGASPPAGEVHNGNGADHAH
jgi:hypothetical protein